MHVSESLSLLHGILEGIGNIVKIPYCGELKQEANETLGSLRINLGLIRIDQN